MEAKDQLGALLVAFKEADNPETKAFIAKAMRELAEKEVERLKNA